MLLFVSKTSTIYLNFRGERQSKMKISKLIGQHFSVSVSIGLTHNFGDSYLCRNNKIYRNIRIETLKLGYNFSHEQNDAYQALPLSQLAVILSTKKIPYLDNVSVLKQLEDKIPDQVNWDDINDNLRKNFIFHESCHAVARELIKDVKNEDKVLNMLIEESFANTCELLAVIDATEATHRIFYEWNSYAALFEAKTNLKNAVNEIGHDAFFKIIFFGYLHSNFLFNNIDEKQFNRIIKIAAPHSLTVKQIKTAKALAKICFTLDPGFKEVTTRFYMRLNGISAEFAKRADFSYFENFEKNSDYRDCVGKLILVVTGQ